MVVFERSELPISLFSSSTESILLSGKTRYDVAERINEGAGCIRPVGERGRCRIHMYRAANWSNSQRQSSDLTPRGREVARAC